MTPCGVGLHRVNRLGGDLVAGGLAGLMATVPMTVVMEALRRQLPHTERHALPPRHVTSRASHRAGLGRHLAGGARRTGVTLVAHFAYGGAAGSLFGPLARLTGLSPTLVGVGYGLVVWCVSYLGLLPAAALFPPATDVSPRRNALMIAAHLVWGAALGALTGSRLAPDEPEAGASFDR